MQTSSRVLLLGVVALLSTGCRTYSVWQAEHWNRAGFQPNSIRNAAVVMFAPWSEIGGEKIETIGSSNELQRNKTFGEALIIAMQKRGVSIVEQRLVDAAQQEARLVLTRAADVVTTKELTSRLGRQLSLDAIIYADALARRSVYDFRPKNFLGIGTSTSEALSRQQQANERQSITPEDIRKCNITVHHSVGVSLRVVDVATGQIQWVGYRHYAVAEDYSADHPDVLSTFSAVKKVAQMVLTDLYGSSSRVAANYDKPSSNGVNQ